MSNWCFSYSVRLYGWRLMLHSGSPQCIQAIFLRMEKDRRFNFKLLVPPRVNNNQVSAVKPQETVDNGAELGPSKYFAKDQSKPFLNKNVVAPTKPTRQDALKMKVAPTEKERECSPGLLYSKIFDEVEKIKCWKAKVDCVAVQSERKLQENKRTIDSQRNAIKELQFENESLSIKLEEQISENEDLTNKNNATRNLCNILKETFERSADKMQILESEREETHHLLMENSNSVQKLIAAFDHLRSQAEADQKELQTVKEAVLQFEALKEKYQQEHAMKEKEVLTFKTNLQDKEGELKKVQCDLHDAQDQYKLLQQATNQQSEDLKNLKMEQESLREKLHSAEQCCKDIETNRKAIAAMLEESKEEYAQVVSSKDLSLQELCRVKNEQAEKLERVQAIVLELQNALAFEEQRSKECEAKLMVNNKELERSKLLLETKEQSARKDEQIRILESELDKSMTSMELMKGKTDVLEVTVNQLQMELSAKAQTAQLSMSKAEMTFAENERLRKACEAAEKAEEASMEKCSVMESQLGELKEQLFNEMKKTEECSIVMLQLKEELPQYQTKYEELLSNFNDVQNEKKAVEQQFEDRTSNVKAMEANLKVSEEKAVKLTKHVQRLEVENQQLREEVLAIPTLIKAQCEEKLTTLQKNMEDNCEHLQKKLTKSESQVKAAEAKLSNLRKKIGTNHKAQGEYQKEIKMLKKQMAKEIEKSSQLENKVNSLRKESQNLKRQHEEKHQKLLKDFKSTSSVAADLDNEILKLRSTTAEAIKSKEDAELKCQHKTADMVALMEKHKSQYDRMVEEKDAELDVIKKREMEAVACRKSLELDVSKLKIENGQLKKQLMTEKGNFQKDLSDLRKELSSLKFSWLSEEKNKKASAFNTNEGRCADTPRSTSSKMNVFDFSKESDTGSIGKTNGTTPQNKEMRREDLTAPESAASRVSRTSKIKTYRIRTPPSIGKLASLEKRTIELESDSSDPNNLWTWASTSESCFPGLLSKCNKKSPAQKSPGNALKLAAMKRMRDAGWTAVVGCDKKKKMTHEKIFA
ncbi:synaptonemal complex protein 1 isoform X2 [Dunckerocampus dactyliophorus]|uniref:synaptonemal complex protein 1 isoform X2 n=1 Tax=Dunckerocampus dactyliophorus TaxID=161453 RepID=UPI00240701CD|nr:synaptonemal complex protein 1 isoform X2 [Dunckerocampus dactyliophorus]